MHLHQRHTLRGRVEHRSMRVIIAQERQLHVVHHAVPQIALRADVRLFVCHVMLGHRVHVLRSVRARLDLIVREPQRGFRVRQLAALPRRQAVVPHAAVVVVGARFAARLHVVVVGAHARFQRFGALLDRAEVGVLAVARHTDALSGRAPVAVGAPLAVVAGGVVGRPLGGRGHAALVHAHVRV